MLVPNVVDGLRSVPDPVRQAATAMGFGPTRRLVQVELPLAIPIVIAGLRIAVVSSISLVSVGALIGVNSLGYFFIDGLHRSFNEEIYAAMIGVIVLALVCDLILVMVRWLLTPWSRGRGRPRRGVAEASADGTEQAVLAEEGWRGNELPDLRVGLAQVPGTMARLGRHPDPDRAAPRLHRAVPARGRADRAAARRGHRALRPGRVRSSSTWPTPGGPSRPWGC